MALIKVPSIMHGQHIKHSQTESRQFRLKIRTTIVWEKLYLNLFEY